MKRTAPLAALLALLSSALLAPRVLAGTEANELLYFRTTPMQIANIPSGLISAPLLLKAVNDHLQNLILPGMHLFLTSEYAVVAHEQVNTSAAAWNLAEAATGAEPSPRYFPWTAAMKTAHQELSRGVCAKNLTNIREAGQRLAALYDDAARTAGPEPVSVPAPAEAPSISRGAVVNYLQAVLDDDDREFLRKRRDRMTPETAVVERDHLLNKLMLDQLGSEAPLPELARRLQESQLKNETALDPDLVEALKDILAALGSSELREIQNPYFRLIAALTAADRRANGADELPPVDDVPLLAHVRMPAVDRTSLRQYESRQQGIVP